MAFVPVSLSECQNWMAAILVAAPDDGSDAPTSTDQEKYNATVVTRAIQYCDLEVCHWIVLSLGNGYRSQYIADSGDLAYGAQIPFHPGRTGQVQVKVNGVYGPGILAPSLEAIVRWKANPTLFPNAAGRYYITEEEECWFTGDSLKIKLAADLVKTSVCQAPMVYTPTVIRGATAIMLQDGADPTLFNKASTEYERDQQLILSGINAVPPLDNFKRTVG